MSRTRLVVLISGTGTLLQALLDACPFLGLERLDDVNILSLTT